MGNPMELLLAPLRQRAAFANSLRPLPEWVTESHPGWQQAQGFIDRHKSHGDLRVVPVSRTKDDTLVFKWYCDKCWKKAEPQKDWQVAAGLLRDWGLVSTVQDPEYYGVWTLSEGDA